MKILDLKKDLKTLYQPSAKKVEIVNVPRLQFTMIDGAIEKGKEPGNSPAFQEATLAVYSISYTLKFMLKKRKTNAVDYPVMALEGLWWVEDGVFDITVKDNWFYTLMILQPDVITKDVFADGLAEIKKKKATVRHFPNYGWQISKKVCVCKSYTSDRTPPNPPPSNGCAPSRWRMAIETASDRTGSITKSISVIRAKQTRRN